MNMALAQQPTDFALSPLATDSEGDLRAIGYRILGRLLARSADETLLGSLRDLRVDERCAGRDMAAAWSMLKLAAQKASVEQVEDEFTELFIGIGRGELVPYGSWYLTGFLMEKPLAVLRRDLAALGFERQPGVTEPEDHAAALCDVMCLLASAQPRTPFEQQKEFFEQHLGCWMERFFDDLQRAERACFYRAVGQLGSSFMGVEKRYFSMQV
jgi:TorA maturation chaperone TorD